MAMMKRTWACKDDNGCQFMATVVIDADEVYYYPNSVVYIDGARRYSAFRITTSTLKELKARVAAL